MKDFTHKYFFKKELTNKDLSILYNRLTSNLKEHDYGCNGNPLCNICPITRYPYCTLYYSKNNRRYCEADIYKRITYILKKYYTKEKLFEILL